MEKYKEIAKRIIRTAYERDSDLYAHEIRAIIMNDINFAGNNLIALLEKYGVFIDGKGIDINGMSSDIFKNGSDWCYRLKWLGLGYAERHKPTKRKDLTGYF